MMSIVRARKFLAKLTLGLIFLTLILVLTIGYTNDSRISMPDIAALSPKKSEMHWHRTGSILTTAEANRKSITSTASAELIERVKKEFSENTKQFLMTKSARFSHPQQVFIPIGAYPDRIEGRDGLLIPVGSSISISLPPGIRRIRSSATALLSDSELSVEIDAGGKTQTSIHLDQATTFINTQSRWYQKIGKFFIVDPDLSKWRWREIVIENPNRDINAVTLTCQSSTVACVIGDVMFFNATANPQQILLMLVDTMRNDALDLGNAPNMNELAKEGIRFKNTIAAGNMTSPSTNAFLACQLPTELGDVAFSYALSSTSQETHYSQAKKSFPDVLKNAGFLTAAIGNISVISDVMGVGVNHGFEQAISIEMEGYDTPKTTREAMLWLVEHRDEDFLLYVHLNGPHAPYRAPFKDIFATFPGWPALQSYGDALRWLYQGEIRYSDRYIKKLLETTKTLGLDSSLLTLLTADHGDHMTNHRFTGNDAGPPYIGAFFDHGATGLNDEVSVPLVIKSPMIFGQHQMGISSKWVSTLDIGPTLLDLFEIPIPSYCRGRSLRSDLGFTPRMNTATNSENTNAIIPNEGYRHRAIIFDGHFKYIRAYETTEKLLFAPFALRGRPAQVFIGEELYDLDYDPSEDHNLIKNNLELTAKARRIFDSFYAIKSGFELVLENPSSDLTHFQVKVTGNTRLENQAPGPVATIVAEDQKYRIYDVAIQNRGVLNLINWDNIEPEVSFAQKVVAISFTADRLALQVPLTELPIESAGETGLLQVGLKAGAYIRQVLTNDRVVRRIASGNPMFDKVLREWGYLHED